MVVFGVIPEFCNIIDVNVVVSDSMHYIIIEKRHVLEVYGQKITISTPDDARVLMMPMEVDDK